MGNLKVVDLGFKYPIYKDEVYSIKKSLVEVPRNLYNLIRYQNIKKIRYFWALKNVNLEISPGTFVTLTGPNGSGKTTLLRVLSGIFQPTQGRFHYHGKIVPVLELGLNFFPDLTGRENILLYATIFKLSKKEALHRADRVLEFADITEFGDVPVMKYSPGMKTKLSYAVTTVHEPDILLLDEVFSVGDQEFQERCLEHFKQLKKENKIIIFVTNNPIQANKISDVRYKLKKGQLFKP